MLQLMKEYRFMVLMFNYCTKKSNSFINLYNYSFTFIFLVTEKWVEGVTSLAFLPRHDHNSTLFSLVRGPILSVCMRNSIIF